MHDAVCLIRDREPYAQSQFVEGLRACGYNVSHEIRRPPNPGDVLLIWNRGGIRDHYARQYEAIGAKVIVAENGWIGKTKDGGKFYSLCLGWHNGLGQWKVGPEDRWPLLNTGLHPWRSAGDHILVLPSRGIGAPAIGMPREWPVQIVKRLRKQTRRPIKIRPHPGDKNADLTDDLRNCHAVVTWGSGAAVKAIAAGIPAFYELEHWIGAGAAKRLGEDIEDPFLGDRMPTFERMAWASWDANEISTGKPFNWLLM